LLFCFTFWLGFKRPDVLLNHVDKRLSSRTRGPEFETRRGDGNLTKANPLEKSGDRTLSAPTICEGLLFGSRSKNKFFKKKSLKNFTRLKILNDILLNSEKIILKFV